MTDEAQNTTPTFGVDDTSFKAAGGYDGLRALVDEFYRLMHDEAHTETIRSMHPGDLTVSRDKLTRFLCGWLGGPRLYSEKYGALNIPGAHSHLPIGEGERDQWLWCMRKAIASQPYSKEFSAYLMEQFQVPANGVYQRVQKEAAKRGDA